MFARRRSALLLWLATAVFSWYGMMAVHESGHVLGAWASGGEVERVVLQPLSFSRTDLSRNPHPAFVAWAGLVWGAAFPVILWMAALGCRVRWAFLLRYFAGFCLITNGAYLASAMAIPAGDTADLLRHGVPVWLMTVVGIPTVAAGLVLWHGLGREFGFRRQTLPNGN